TLADEVLKAMSLGKLKTLTAFVLALVLTAGAGAVGYRALAAPRPAPPPEAPPQPAPAGTARVDRYGDPLPAGAVARLGTTRLRSAHTITAVHFSADGRTVVGSGWDNTTRAWDAATGRLLHQLSLSEEQRGPLAVSPDGRTVAAAGRKQDRRLRLWDLATGKL